VQLLQPVQPESMCTEDHMDMDACMGLESVEQCPTQTSMSYTECPTQITTQITAQKTTHRHIGTQTLKPRSGRKHDTNTILQTSCGETSNPISHLIDHSYTCTAPRPTPLPVPLPACSVTMSQTVDIETVLTDTLSTCDKQSCTSGDDSDDEYRCSNSEESSDDSDPENDINCTNDSKFIVYQCQLDELFKFCQQCGSPVCEISKINTGSMLTIRTLCLQNHQYTWNSQPITENNVPAGNLMIPAAIVFTGGSFQEFSSFAEALKLNFISRSCFYNVQNNVIFPIIKKEYKEQQLSLISDLKNNGPINLCGDGRSDSPGHNAKYGTYSLMHEESGKIVDFSLVHVSEVSSSYAMEYEGCKRSLDNLLNHQLPIRCLSTDRHVQITAQLQKRYPNIKHQYDVWHLAKSVTKKLTQKAKTKCNDELRPWIKSISNHLWWTVQTCNEDPEILVRNWVSIVNHVADQHSWKEGEASVSCKHARLTKRERKQIMWLKPGSSAHVALEEIVCNKKLLKDIKKLTEFHHTGNLEVFHSLLLKYAPKRKHFSYHGMISRTQLAILDHNNNANRSQATTKKGEKRYKVVFPKNRKTWVAKPILEDKSYTFVTELMDEVIECHEAGTKAPKLRTPAHIPKNIATVQRPPKEEVIKQHISRMVKKKKEER